MSGTLAEPDQRLDFVEHLLASSDDNTRLLGIDALDAALKASAFSSSTDVTKFGGRARSLGWHPETNEQIERLFARAATRLRHLPSRMVHSQSGRGRLWRTTSGNSLGGICPHRRGGRIRCASARFLGRRLARNLHASAFQPSGHGQRTARTPRSARAPAVAQNTRRALRGVRAPPQLGILHSLPET